MQHELSREPLLPTWPEDCRPDRFLLRPVDFGDLEPAGPGEVQRTGTYVNPLAAWSAPQEFPMTAFAPAGAREEILAFTDRLRVWIEAVPATSEMEEAMAPAGIRAEKKSTRRERDAITLEIGRLTNNTDDAMVFSIIDPQVDSVRTGRAHDYRRRNAGLARITVSRGDAELRGVTGGPYRRQGGGITPQASAGRSCRVWGYAYSEYTIGSAWRD
jgi:hypothetical protein